MYHYSWNDSRQAKALNRMYDEVFDEYGDIRDRKCFKRLRREFVEKINQDPVMRYDWRWMNVGVFPLSAFGDMCNALNVSFSLIDKETGRTVSSGIGKTTVTAHNIPLSDFINSLEYVGLAATIDGIEIKPFDFNANVNTKLGVRE